MNPELVMIVPFDPEMPLERISKETLLRQFQAIARERMVRYSSRDEEHKVMWIPYQSRAEFISNCLSTVFRNPNVGVWELGNSSLPLPNPEDALTFIDKHVRNGVYTLGIIYDYRVCPQLVQLLIRRFCRRETTLMPVVQEGGVIFLDIKIGMPEHWE